VTNLPPDGILKVVGQQATAIVPLPDGILKMAADHPAIVTNLPQTGF
ncbi:MAG: hypothetical protein HC780_27645, partial [Leptolyngbyaceae cyanobacterium CSU_1_3]|nr:hypothetical protein [Leptolyngbyaceae cyanobacterium CSU_1_3]